MENEIIKQITRLTGFTPPIPTSIPLKFINILHKNGKDFTYIKEDEPKKGIGHSQFNEVLLSLGYDRISKSFFQYLVNGTTKYIEGSSITSIEELIEGVDRFVKLALRTFGNVKRGFSQVSVYEEDFDALVEQMDLEKPVSDFSKRNDQINDRIPIPGLETFLLGYIANTVGIDDALISKTDEVKKSAFKNHEAYLASDHMDVYIATSMREPIHFTNINNTVEKIFSEPELKDLNLRYFNPTQAYCNERIDKGLSEALMLKRAKCTIYFAQESETLGKDSELASTLAQGKTVIAFVPHGDKTFVKELIEESYSIYSNKAKIEVLLEILKLYNPDLAWQDSEVIEWIRNKDQIDLETVTNKIESIVCDYYEDRAKKLKESHPLGIQVHLDTGVANGVLVVRNERDCADLIKAIILNKMSFSLKSEIKVISGTEQEYVYLIENISNSIYRVMSGDKLLTNAFWNFYLLTD